MIANEVASMGSFNSSEVGWATLRVGVVGLKIRITGTRKETIFDRYGVLPANLFKISMKEHTHLGISTNTLAAVSLT